MSPVFRLLLALLLSTPSYAQQTQDQSKDYFATAGRLIGEVKSVSWIGQNCAASHPEIKSDIDVALDEWSKRNHEQSSVLDAQFDVMLKYWASLPEGLRRGHPTKQQMIAELDQQRSSLKKMMEAENPDARRRTCSGYAGVLNSKQMDVEVRWTKQMVIVRRGPR